MKKKILIGIVAVLIIMQFFRIDKSAPEVISANDFVVMNQAPSEITQMLKAACYDCHSHETKYPWYTNVAPLSFWIKGHIKGGKQKLNFSEWSAYDAGKKTHKIEECIEEMEDNHMPLKSYTWLHPEGKLSKEQKDELIAWLKTASK